jgi:hypothetical protein
MQDNKTTRDFRKGYIGSKMAEDPTYLTFFFMFDYYTENSPLFNGEAVRYLENVVGDEARANSLKNFIKILQRVNSEMPWFWQGVTGLEVTRQYGNLAAPFWGAEKPSIEIECLETVELTTSGMIDLYKRAAFDFSRWVEVLPKNLRMFRMMVWVSEVRTFTGRSSQKLLKGLNQLAGGAGDQNIQSVFNRAGSDSNSVKEVRPFFKVTLGRCQFDMDSTSSILSELKRTPEGPITTNIKIFWETVEEDGEYANNALTSQERKLGEMLADTIQSKVGSTIDGAIDRTIESTRARLLLGNVHGLNAASTIQDAINTGSINGIANLIGGNQNRKKAKPSGDLGGAFEPVPLRSTQTTDANVYGRTPTDSEGPINQNVYDRMPTDSEGPINQNVHK